MTLQARVGGKCSAAQQGIWAVCLPAHSLSCVTPGSAMAKGWWYVSACAWGRGGSRPPPIVPGAIFITPMSWKLADGSFRTVCRDCCPPSPKGVCRDTTAGTVEWHGVTMACRQPARVLHSGQELPVISSPGQSLQLALPPSSQPATFSWLQAPSQTLPPPIFHPYPRSEPPPGP